MKTVEVHPAFFFICDNCGRTVYFTGDRVPKSTVLESAPKEDRQFIRKHFKKEECVPVVPDVVKCTFEDCGTEFIAE